VVQNTTHSCARSLPQSPLVYSSPNLLVLLPPPPTSCSTPSSASSPANRCRSRPPTLGHEDQGRAVSQPRKSGSGSHGRPRSPRLPRLRRGRAMGVGRGLPPWSAGRTSPPLVFSPRPHRRISPCRPNLGRVRDCAVGLRHDSLVVDLRE
jgi:hypothetical protein